MVDIVEPIELPKMCLKNGLLKTKILESKMNFKMLSQFNMAQCEELISSQCFSLLTRMTSNAKLVNRPTTSKHSKIWFTGMDKLLMNRPYANKSLK